MTANPNGTFTDNFVSMADDLGAWLSSGLDLSKFVTFADSTGAAVVNVPKAPAEIYHGTGEVVDNAVSSVTGAVSGLENRALMVGAGAAGLLALALVLRSPRRRRR